MSTKRKYRIGLILIAVCFTLLALSEGAWALISFHLFDSNYNVPQLIISFTQWINPTALLLGVAGAWLIIKRVKTKWPICGFFLMLIPEVYFLLYGVGIIDASSLAYLIMMSLPLTGTVILTVSLGMNKYVEHKWMLLIGLSLLSLRWVFHVTHMYLTTFDSSFMEWNISNFFDSYMPMIIWVLVAVGAWILALSNLDYKEAEGVLVEKTDDEDDIIM